MPCCLSERVRGTVSCWTSLCQILCTKPSNARVTCFICLSMFMTICNPRFYDVRDGGGGGGGAEGGPGGGGRGGLGGRGVGRRGKFDASGHVSCASVLPLSFELFCHSSLVLFLPPCQCIVFVDPNNWCSVLTLAKNQGERISIFNGGLQQVTLHENE